MAPPDVLTCLWVLILVALCTILCLFYSINPNDPNGIYTALDLTPANDEIRLVYLDPGNWEEEIRCRLKKVGLGEDPVFTALSYAWKENFPCAAEHKEHMLIRFLERHGFKTLVKRIRLMWGDRRKRLIWVNSVQHEVGVNLELALRHIRKQRGGKDLRKGQEEGLWADAICINQNDIEDRNKQVSSMREVYKKAARVVIWLGPERDVRGTDDNNIRCFDLNRFAPSMQDRRDGEDIVWSHVPQEDEANNADVERVRTYEHCWYQYNNRPKLLRADTSPDYTMEFFCMIYMLGDPDLLTCCTGGKRHVALDERIPFLKTATARRPVIEVFQDVMHRLWWNRLWVVQETVIAQEISVRYGRFVLPWENLVLAANNFYKHRHKACCSIDYEKLPSEDVQALANFADTVTGLNTWRESWRADDLLEPKIKLLRLLWQFRSRSTSELRDKVYALLPLVNNWGPPKHHRKIDPQYGWSIADVYKSAVRTIIFTENSLVVLMGNTLKSPKLADLPSWAPDWSVSPIEGENARLDRSSLYHAAGEARMQFRILGNNKYLELHGIQHDVVTVVSELMPKETDAKSYAATQKTFQAWQKVTRRSDPDGTMPYVNRDYSNKHAYWRTVCMDTIYIPKVNDTDNIELDKQDYNRLEDYAEELEKWDEVPTNTSQSSEITGLTRKRRTVTYKQPNSRDASPEDFRRRNTPVDDEASKINRAAETATVSRRFFMTAKGYMGLGPDHMRDGDFVFVLYGGPVPFLLRNAGRQSVPINSQQADDCEVRYDVAPIKEDDDDVRGPVIPFDTIDDMPTPAGSFDTVTDTTDLPSAPESVGIDIQPTANGQSESELRDRSKRKDSVLPEDVVDTTRLSRVTTLEAQTSSPADPNQANDNLYQCYELIGDCFVQGIMDGEALVDEEGAAVNPEKIYLV